MHARRHVHDTPAWPGNLLKHFDHQGRWWPKGYQEPRPRTAFGPCTTLHSARTWPVWPQIATPSTPRLLATSFSANNGTLHSAKKSLERGQRKTLADRDGQEWAVGTPPALQYQVLELTGWKRLSLLRWAKRRRHTTQLRQQVKGLCAVSGRHQGDAGGTACRGTQGTSSNTSQHVPRRTHTVCLRGHQPRKRRPGAGAIHTHTVHTPHKHAPANTLKERRRTLWTHQGHAVQGAGGTAQYQHATADGSAGPVCHVLRDATQRPRRTQCQWA